MADPILALCSISALDRPLAEAAALAAAHGLALEVTARDPHLAPDADPAAARRAADVVRDAGTEVVAYGSYLGRAGTLDAANARREVAVTAALDTPLLRVWAEPLEGEPESGFAAVVAGFQAACDVAADAGVQLVVERHIGSFADTPERVERLLDAVGRPNFALNYQVLDLLPQSEASAQPADARRLVPRARYFHLKNTRPAADGAGPMPPGGALEGGVLDYRALLAAAFEAGYAGPLTIEFLAWDERPVEEKLAADVAYLRRLLAELGR
ncbi:MAG: TIM barrel protein [Myxococcota bacterium]|nr:TIM barrel protein [Myxococcota bacterium]